jgi:hypothetical protein
MPRTTNQDSTNVTVASWSKSVPYIDSWQTKEPVLSQYKSFLEKTGPQSGNQNPDSQYWGTQSQAINMNLLGSQVQAGEFLAWAGETGPGGCGCTNDKDPNWTWSGKTNTHLHIFFTRRDPSNNEWYFIDPSGIYGPPVCYPTHMTDPITTPCARYPISWKGGKPQYP